MGVRQLEAAAHARAMTTPSSSSTSADPHCDDTDRLPCLATHAPQAAATMDAAVEKFTVWCPSPPVPTMSTHEPPGSTVTICSRITDTMPATSEGVSPFARSSRRKADVWQGSTPAMMPRMPDSASSRVRSRRVTSASMSGFRFGGADGIDGSGSLRFIVARPLERRRGAGELVTHNQKPSSADIFTPGYMFYNCTCTRLPRRPSLSSARCSRRFSGWG